MSTDDVSKVKDALDALGPFGVLTALHVPFIREGRNARFRCLWHTERTASTTLRIGPQGSLQAHCHGACGRSWDSLALVAAVQGLDVKADFRRVLEEAAAVAGVHLDVLAPRVRAPRPPPPPPPPPRYAAGVADLWNRCGPVDADPDVADYLCVRGLDPVAVAARDLARALPTDGPSPGWARCRGQTWAESGHRLLTPAYDASGALRAVRATRVRDGEGPKRLTPGGTSTSGLVLACPAARLLLSGQGSASRIAITEGETDFLTACLAWPDLAVFGIWSGAWTADLAARIPDGAAVLVATDHDPAGDAYAGQITRSLAGRCDVRRFRKATP